MASKRAPIAVVRGNTKLFINDPAMLQAALEALNGETKGTSSSLACLAQAAETIMEAVSSVCPDIRIRSLRDVMFHMRHKVPAKDLKYIKDVHIAYSLLRHMCPNGIVNTAREVGERLADDTRHGVNGYSSSSTEFLERNCSTGDCSAPDEYKDEKGGDHQEFDLSDYYGFADVAIQTNHTAPDHSNDEYDMLLAKVESTHTETAEWAAAVFPVQAERAYMELEDFKSRACTFEKEVRGMAIHAAQNHKQLVSDLDAHKAAQLKIVQENQVMRALIQRMRAAEKTAAEEWRNGKDKKKDNQIRADTKTKEECDLLQQAELVSWARPSAIG
eukprot:TRINITY_DN25254_c0_g1_i1.p1 TRINITY_DN25254_c0_g1~~TRINITY_DN25254_c0_g1_i1.p1  ORF type:complete len:330 (+),score=78.56 TRINITY_DN25254_c0_g1_i1:73-1062(+)